ncbi:MAG: acyltransferase family protein [Oxalicibacterium faecigallinarum]|uniref:acyltransferase family protein n=1 Tax=Oxalicibacterium faecigallinarum TaxID=573741 RepID=UPI002808555D|nr:acyltransferase family protein [Oxalicibacterium faecigallinarum]MDQ7969961.1 acyltransferase family protein [Oxalicibacterium faecigallinarum]
MTASTLSAITHPPQTKTRSRLPMIDVAKGVGILLIVLGHNRIFSSHYGDAANFLAAFRLPFFFFISGVIFSAANRSIGNVALVRADAWLKPYAMALLIGGMLKLIVGKETVESVLLGIFYGTGFTLGWNVLWFLPHLWLLYVSVSILVKYGQELIDSWPKKIGLLLTFLCLGFYVMGSFDTVADNPACDRIMAVDPELLHCGLPFSADVLLLSATYFLLGHFLATPARTFRFNVIGMAIAIAVSLMLNAQYGFRIDFNMRRYDSLLISTVQALAGIYMMLCVCTLLARIPKVQALLSYIGRGSLMILICHAQIQFPLVAALQNHVPPLLAGTIAFVSCTAISLMLWEICKRNALLSTLFLPLNWKKKPAS